MTIPKFQLPSFDEVPEPQLQFHPDRETDSDTHPLRGLRQFGPYSRSTPFAAPDPIRLAVIGPRQSLGKLRAFISELRRSHTPKERTQYLLEYPGFSSVMGVGLSDPTAEATIPIDEDVVSKALADARPQDRLAEIVHSAVRRLSTVRPRFDVALLYLPNEWSVGFRSPPDDLTEDFDLHDSVKAFCGGVGIPMQMLNDDALEYHCRCSVSWRLSIALYVKAGGIPWKLKGYDDNHAYVGLSYCLRKSTERRFVTCCSQIFDGRGTGLQFLLYESGDGQHAGENPYLSRTDMHRVMSRTLAIYQRQRGKPPTRLVVHKTTPFLRDEIDGVNDAVSSIDDVELLTVSDETPWQGIRIDAPREREKTQGDAANYPIRRGTMMPLGIYDYLLWSPGVVSGIGQREYFKEGKAIPRPLKITRHQGRGSFFEGAREILGLTKMNWNNDSLYDRIPVSLSYASVLAGVVKRFGSLAHTPYEARFFM